MPATLSYCTVVRYAIIAIISQYYNCIMRYLIFYCILLYTTVSSCILLQLQFCIILYPRFWRYTPVVTLNKTILISHYASKKTIANHLGTAADSMRHLKCDVIEHQLQYVQHSANKLCSNDILKN